MDAKKRLLYIDNIRLLMIALVVVQHLSVTYSGMGSWYYREGRPLGFVAQALFGFYQALQQGYFMGLLFLIAGYFVPGAYDRKGLSRFLKDRLIRLGIPTLIYMLALYPLVVYVILGNRSYGESFLGWYAAYIGSFDFIGGTGALWFLLALLIFTAVYGLGRWAFEKLRWSLPAPQLGTGPRGVMALILIIAIPTFLVRIVQPVGTSFYNMMLCNFSQYIVLFVVGILAYRQDWFSRLDYTIGTRLLWWAPTFGFAAWGAIELLGGAAADPTAVNGGFTWQSAAFSLWESFTCVAASTGLLVLFREKLNAQNRLVKSLSDSGFAVYVFHAPVIITLTLLFRPVPWLPGFKFAAMCLVCLPLCFAAAYFVILRIPLLKKVM